MHNYEFKITKLRYNPKLHTFDEIFIEKSTIKLVEIKIFRLKLSSQCNLNMPLYKIEKVAQCTVLLKISLQLSTEENENYFVKFQFFCTSKFGSSRICVNFFVIFYFVLNWTTITAFN